MGRSAGFDNIYGFALAPDDEFLLYSAGSSRRNVWLRRPDGIETQLTFEDDAVSPRFAADGESVIYLERRSLWRYRLADGSREQLCPGLPARDFVAAPDGNRILVLQGNSNVSADLFLCHADGSEPPRVLVSELPRSAGLPVVSPDSRTVYFIRETESTRYSLHAADVVTGETSELRQLDGPAALTSISPDGQWLAANHGFALSNGWLYPIEGDAEPRQIADGWDFEWSPDGSSFLFLNDGMVSSAWELPNPEGLLLPEDLPEHPDTTWLREAGAVRLMSAMGFSRASASPKLFEAVYARTEHRSNLYSIQLPR